MEAKDIDKLTNETIAKGGILAVLLFDLHTSRKDTLAQLGTALVQKILGEPGVVYAVGEIEEPLEKEGMFSSTVEVKVLAKDLSSLAHLCGNHSPFSVNIKRPDSLKLTVDQAHTLLMDISINNYELKKTMLQKVYKGEDLERLKRKVEARLELGKKALEKK